MSELHLVIPMGGTGSRFYKDRHIKPKPLIEIEEKPFFYWATQSIVKFIDVKSLTFVVLQDHIDKYNIDKKIIKFYPESEIVVIDQVLEGAVLTCLEGIRQINDNSPVMFNDCDHMFKCNSFNSLFLDKNNESKIDFDGGLITFNSSEPRFSYVEYNEYGKIIGTVEKEVVSNKAICGAYFFRNAEIFKKMSEKYLKECKYSEFYLSGVYNVMCSHKLKINSFDVDFHVSFGTPEEYQYAKESNRFSLL